MADSIRTQIKNAVAAALSAPGTPAVLERAITGPIAESNLSVYVLQLVNESIGVSQLEADTRVLNLRIICAVSTNANLDDATEPLINWAENQIGSSADLADLTTGIACSGIAWQYDTGDQDFIGAVMEYQFTYDTHVHEPEELATY